MKKRASLAFKTQCVLHSYTKTLPEKVAAAIDISSFAVEVSDCKEATTDIQNEIQHLQENDVQKSTSTLQLQSNSYIRKTTSGTSNSSLNWISHFPSLSENAPTRLSFHSSNKLPVVLKKSSSLKNSTGVHVSNPNSKRNTTTATKVVIPPTDSTTHKNGGTFPDGHPSEMLSLSSMSHSKVDSSPNALPQVEKGSCQPSFFSNSRQKNESSMLDRPLLPRYAKVESTSTRTSSMRTSLKSLSSSRDEKKVSTRFSAVSASPVIVYVLDLPGVLAPSHSLLALRERKLAALPEFCLDNISQLDKWFQSGSFADSQFHGSTNWEDVTRGDRGSGRQSGSVGDVVVGRSSYVSSLTSSLLPEDNQSQDSCLTPEASAFQRLQEFLRIVVFVAENHSNMRSAYASAKENSFQNEDANTHLSTLLVEHFSELIRSTPIASAVPAKFSYIRDIEALLMWYMCQHSKLTTKVFNDVKPFLEAMTSSGGISGGLSSSAVPSSDAVGGKNSSKTIPSHDCEGKENTALSMETPIENRHVVLFSSIQEEELKIFLDNTNVGPLSSYFAAYIHTSFAGSKLLPRSYSKIRSHLVEKFHTRNIHIVFLTSNLTEASGADTSGDVDVSFLALRPGNEFIPLDTFFAVSIPFFVSLQQVCHPTEPIDLEALANEALID